MLNKAINHKNTIKLSQDLCLVIPSVLKKTLCKILPCESVYVYIYSARLCCLLIGSVEVVDCCVNAS
jgi:hypothetical protein